MGMSPQSNAERLRRSKKGKENMPKFISAGVSNAFSFAIPTLLGTFFFFIIIGVFGIWIAIGGLLLGLVLASAIVGRIPVEGEIR
jgi:hypothetical protein